MPDAIQIWKKVRLVIPNSFCFVYKNKVKWNVQPLLHDYTIMAECVTLFLFADPNETMMPSKELQFTVI